MTDEEVVYLRAQFALVDAGFLAVTHGDIFQVVGRNKSDGSLEAVNVFSGALGRLPRRAKQPYAHLHRKEICYTQPVLLLGSLASHVGDLLVARQAERFATAVPHTTRPRRGTERHGREYWFVRPATMQSMVKSDLFVECGSLGEFLYGTTEAAIRSVAQRERKHCVLDASIDVRRLLARDLHPLVFVVGAQSWRQLQDVICYDGGSEFHARELFAKDVELVETMALSLSGIVREGSLEACYQRLTQLIERLSSGPAWIPQTSSPFGRLI